MTLSAGWAHAAAYDCDIVQAALTLRQTGKYTLVRQDCPAAEPTLDAPRRESLALQLYGQAATVTIGSLERVEEPASHNSAARKAPLQRPALPGARSAVPLPASGLRALQLAPDVDAVAQRYDIDPLLLHAIAHVESRHNAQAVSKAGALGVMQVMPATAGRFGVANARALHHTRTNLEVSASYLKTLQKRFGNDLPLVLAAYNAGEGSVERYGRTIPPFGETQRYVKSVIAQYETLLAAAP